MSFFDNAYAGTPPWDIGKEQGAFKRIIENHNINGPLLDIGCGTGENSLFIAKQLNISVTGIDTSNTAISKASEKAQLRNLQENATFLNYDLFKLSEFNKKFNTIIDCGVFHMFDARSRVEYQNNVKKILHKNGKLFILAFSYLEPLGIGPSQRLKERDYYNAFQNGWKILNFEHEEFETNVRKNSSKALLTTVERI